MTKRLLCLALALILLIGCAGCGRKRIPAPTEEETVFPEFTAAPTTEAPTEETTVPTTEALTEPTTVPTEPPLILHSGLREDGSFDEGTLFIGDSLTLLFLNHYLKTQGYLGDAKYLSQASSQLTIFMDGKTRVVCSATNTLASKEFNGMLFNEAAASLGEKATAIYIMWGTNYTPSASAESYIEIVDFLLENCPNATVHLQLISWADPNIIPVSKINQRITDAYNHYQEIGEPRVMLIDTYTAIGQNVISDGVHHNDTARANWYQAIVDHAADNELPQ